MMIGKDIKIIYDNDRSSCKMTMDSTTVLWIGAVRGWDRRQGRKSIPRPLYYVAVLPR